MDEAINATVYLLEPIDEKNHRKKIVYANSPIDARKISSSSNEPMDRVFGDRDLSTCVQIESDITIIKKTPTSVRFKFNDSTFELNLNEAKDLIIEPIH